MTKRMLSILLVVGFVLVCLAMGVTAELLRPDFPLWARIVLAFVAGTGWLWAFIRYAIDHIEWINIAWHHLRMSVTNNSTSWTLTLDATRDGTQKTAAIDEALQVILSMYKGEARVWVNEPRRKIVHLQGYTVVLKTALDFGGDTPFAIDDLEPESENFRLEMVDLEFPYRRSREVLAEQVMPLLERVANATRPDSETYSMRVRFPESKNPYYSFYVRNLPLDMVRRFAVELDIEMQNQKQTVSIHSDEIAILTSERSALGALALRYLTFSNSVRPTPP